MDENKAELTLVRDEDGLALVGEGQMLRGDFTRMLPRIKVGRLSSELLVKAAKIKNAEGELTAVDATASVNRSSPLKQ